MRTYDISRPPELINIGFDGENKWRPRGFNCTDWLKKHPDGIITLWIQPEGVKKAFPVSTTKTENIIVWYPLSEELYPGTGELQLTIQDGEFIGKSDTIKFEVNKSLNLDGTHPEENPSWAMQIVQDVTEQANRAEEAARTATDAAEDIASAIMESIPEAVDDYFDEHPVVVEESDPTVPEWAKQSEKPTYTADEVGALPDSYTPPVASVNGKTGTVVLDASNVGALPDDTVIPAAVTEQDVARWGFTKNTGTYSKPSGGIPASDLASAVQTSLGKADTALQSHQSLSGYATEQWVENKGYLTQHQSLANYQTKAITDTGNYFTTDTVDGALQEIGAELAGINTLIGSGVIT